MYEDVTILVNSCDSRSDAWKPFFKLLYDFWKNAPEKIVLNSETLDYSCDYLNIKTILSGKGTPWGKRLRSALEAIDTEYIVYFLEDFFLMRDVSDESFGSALQLMRGDPSIGFIGLKYNDHFTMRRDGDVLPNDKFIPKDSILTMHRVNNMTGIWRKDWLLSLVRDHETPWEFDNYASIRSTWSDKKVLIINNVSGGLAPVFDYGVDFEYGYGIYRGKWLPKNKELFEAHGVTDVDYERIGWYVEDQSPSEKSVKNDSLFRRIYVSLAVWKKKTKTFFRKCKSLRRR